MIDFNFQEFRIIGSDYKKVFGVAQFMYKGHEISMSEMGVDKGACPTQTAVFNDAGCVVFEADTVEQCINWINENCRS